MIDSVDPAALEYLFDRLAAAHGPQHWWPHQDVDNPRFEILVGSVLTQHTAWTNVERAIDTLLAAGPMTAKTLLAYDDLASLIRQAGPHRVKAARLRALCQWFIDCGGFEAIDQMSTDTLCAELQGIRGIGPETADAIALYACGRPRFVADAYAFRIFERVGWWQGPRRYEGLRQKIEHAAPNRGAMFFDELHALIIEHAKTTCHKQQPACTQCALADRCDQVGVRPARSAAG